MSPCLHRSRRRLSAIFISALCASLAEGAYAALALLYGLATGEGIDAQATTLLAASTAGMIGATLVVTDLDGARRSAGAGLRLVALSQIVVGVIVLVSLARVWGQSRAFGLDGSIVAIGGVVLGACGALALAAVASWPRNVVRIGGFVVTGALVLVATGAVVAGVGAAVTGTDCDRFRFDADRWAAGVEDDGMSDASDRERMTVTILACRTLDGLTRAEVRAMLGEDDTKRPGIDEWYIGSTNDAGGPGDSDYLRVRYGGNGRVITAGRMYG